MRYVPPTITGTYSAKTVIQSRKGSPAREMDHIQLTTGSGYQSDE